MQKIIKHGIVKTTAISTGVKCSKMVLQVVK